VLVTEDFHIGKTVNVKPKLMSGHETQMGLESGLTDRLIVGRNMTLTLTEDFSLVSDVI
jgi:hypothetical protein